MPTTSMISRFNEKGDGGNIVYSLRPLFPLRAVGEQRHVRLGIVHEVIAEAVQLAFTYLVVEVLAKEIPGCLAERREVLGPPCRRSRKGTEGINNIPSVPFFRGNSSRVAGRSARSQATGSVSAT